jgi:hypothetical protein
MRIALSRTFAAVAITFSFGLTALVHGEAPSAAKQASVAQRAGAPRDVRATGITPDDRHQQGATVKRQQVRVGDGGTVTVLRPVVAARAPDSDPEDDAPRQGPVTWQVAAGWRLWLIDPAAKKLQTCAVRNTSTVGVEEIRCLSLSATGLRRILGPTFAR